MHNNGLGSQKKKPRNSRRFKLIVVSFQMMEMFRNCHEKKQQSCSFRQLLNLLDLNRYDLFWTKITMNCAISLIEMQSIQTCSCQNRWMFVM